VISVTVERYAGNQWKLKPEPSNTHIINMLDDALREHRAFETVVPSGGFVLAYNTETSELTNKTVKRIKKAVESAALVLDKQHEVIFSLGK
jgi:lipoate synthase